MNLHEGFQVLLQKYPRFSLKAFCFDLDQPFSLFSYKSIPSPYASAKDRRKIQWNRTWINIKRKQPAAMLFCFLIFCTTSFSSSISASMIG